MKKKSIFLLSLIPIISFSKIGANLEISNSNFFSFDYDTKGHYNSLNKKWETNPGFYYNKFATEFKALNIKGDFIFEKAGLKINYDLESPYFTHDIESRDKSVVELNPNNNLNPRVNIGATYIKQINNAEHIFKTKYNLSTFKGLEKFEKNILDLEYNLNYYANSLKISPKVAYKSKNLINPIDLETEINFFKKIKDYDFSFGVNFKTIFIPEYTKNNLLELFMGSHEHGKQAYQFYVEKILKSHEYSSVKKDIFTDHTKTFNLDSKFNLNLSRKINKNLTININNLLNIKTFELSDDLNGLYYFSNVNLISNKFTFNTRYKNNNFLFIPELNLTYGRTISKNNYNEELKNSGYDIEEIMDKNKNERENFSLELNSKLMYTHQVNDEISIIPRLYSSYSIDANKIILSSEYLKTLDEELAEIEELLRDEPDDEDYKMEKENILNSKNQKYNQKQEIIVQPGLYVKYNPYQNIEIFGSIDVPFIFKDKKWSPLDTVVKKEIPNDEYLKGKKLNKTVIFPLNMEIKTEIGIKHSW